VGKEGENGFTLPRDDQEPSRDTMPNHPKNNASSSHSTPTKEKAMPAKTKKKTSTHATKPAAVNAATQPEAATTASATNPPVIFLTSPPPAANIPEVPSGYVAPAGNIFRGIIPLKTELGVVPAAVKELGEFTDYATVLGTTAPPAAQLAEALDIGGQWSSMRNLTDAWDGYCRFEEGVAWRSIRGMMERLKPTWALAVTADPTLAVRYPNLASLLAAKQQNAKQGAATRALNKQAIARGEPPTHGAVGKKRKRAAEKQAAAAMTGAAPVQTAPVQAAPVQAPVVQSAASTPATPASLPVATAGTTNGVAHS
jgi:hypothetical protein